MGGPLDLALAFRQPLERVEQFRLIRLLRAVGQQFGKPLRAGVHPHLQGANHLEFGQFIYQRLLAGLRRAPSLVALLPLLLLLLGLLQRRQHLLEARHEVLQDAAGRAPHVAPGQAARRLIGVVANLFERLWDRHGRTVVAHQREGLGRIEPDEILLPRQPHCLQLPLAICLRLFRRQLLRASEHGPLGPQHCPQPCFQLHEQPFHLLFPHLPEDLLELCPGRLQLLDRFLLLLPGIPPLGLVEFFLRFPHPLLGSAEPLLRATGTRGIVVAILFASFPRLRLLLRWRRFLALCRFLFRTTTRLLPRLLP